MAEEPGDQGEGLKECSGVEEVEGAMKVDSEEGVKEDGAAEATVEPMGVDAETTTGTTATTATENVRVTRDAQRQ